jgi:hypothetical protein
MLELLEHAAVIVVVLSLAGRNLYRLFIVVLLMTEFYYIPLGGGNARIYHFGSVLVLLRLAKHIPRLLTSRVFVALLAFVAVNLCAIVVSDAPEKAALSFLGFSANLSVAMATALILITGKLDLVSLKKVIMSVTLASVAWALVQVLASRLAGINLALSPMQVEQIAVGFGPGFRTEANTFGKFMVVPLLLFLPDYVEHRRAGIGRLYAVFAVGILMNFTRSAIFGIGLALAAVVRWYRQRGRLVLLARKGARLAVPLTLVVALMVGGVLGFSEYAQYKIANFFNEHELLEGGSSAFRLRMMQFVIDGALSSTRKFIIGNGWGQTRFHLYDVEVQAGGGDLVNVLGYSGAFGVAAYLVYSMLSITAARRVARFSSSERARFAEGLMFALLGVFFTAQIAGYLIAPEYWMLIGFSIFVEVTERKSRVLVPRRFP